MRGSDSDFIWKMLPPDDTFHEQPHLSLFFFQKRGGGEGRERERERERDANLILVVLLWPPSLRYVRDAQFKQTQLSSVRLLRTKGRRE